MVLTLLLLKHSKLVLLLTEEHLKLFGLVAVAIGALSGGFPSKYCIKQYVTERSFKTLLLMNSVTFLDTALQILMTDTTPKPK
jgi:hypothetical protein